MDIRPIDDPYLFLEDIISRSRKEETVRIGDMDLLISTLSAEEESDIYISLTTDKDDPRKMIRDKIDTLSFAIRGINGKRFDYDKIDNPVIRKKERCKSVKMVRDNINTWQDSVVEYVYKKLLKTTEEKLTEQFKLKEIQNG